MTLPQVAQQRRIAIRRPTSTLCAAALALAGLLVPSLAWARASQLPTRSEAILAAANRCQEATPSGTTRKSGEILFQADALSYDIARDDVVADGNVEAAFYSCVLIADHIEYDRKNNIVRANGKIALMEPSGNVVFAQSLELSGGLEQGVVNAFSAILARNSHIAATKALRKSGEITELDHVVYSPCQICNKPGFKPLWQIKAVKVIHDERHKVIKYRGATLEVKGVPVLYMPYFQHSDPSVKRHSGFLIPSFGNSTDLGNNVEIPYFFNLAPNQDVTISPMITADAGTDMKLEYRRRTKAGSMTLDGSFVYADIDTSNPSLPSHQTWRSHLFGEGRFRFSDVWSYGFNTQLTSDDTYLKRYRISDLDRLTTRVYAEGFADRDYASVNGYYFQGLRQQDNPATTPLVLPLGQLSWYPNVHWLGGTVRVDGNVMSLTRQQGGNSHRISLSGRWQREAITKSGHIFTLFAQSRGDLYYTENLNPTNNPALPDNSETVGRALPSVGLQWRWPLVRGGGRYYQVIEPIVQGIWAPYGGNPTNIPNEDSSSFEFDDTNLFSENKLPGLDLVETGPRANVGFRYAVFGPNGEQLELLLGQNFRAKADTIFDPASGFGSRRSDYVGRLHFAPSRYFELIHRFRINRRNFHFNRNEVIARAGVNDYWGRFSYLQLAQDPSEPGLPKREEIEAQTHLKIWGNWSFEGEARRDLINSQMITAGAAFVYSNDCFEIELAYKRRFTVDREIRPSTSFNLRIRLKTFGDSGSRSIAGEEQGVVAGGRMTSQILGAPAYSGIFQQSTTP